ncbi:hypothetical protein LOD99_14249 [Oopsacas minuta]|uniref:Uncharacterized protein n=1 Tax=Oopsacas minuta TaxID=111878 RepID=A0AAV7KFN2_9METZ|nr:hypothetical protein LOD99_14249 [Oopsacas minuta]
MTKPFRNLSFEPICLGQHESDWEFIFKTAVTLMMEKLSISLFPAYLCPRPAGVKFFAQILLTSDIRLKEAFGIVMESDPLQDGRLGLISMSRQGKDMNVINTNRICQ